jgi:hypothetical protein
MGSSHITEEDIQNYLDHNPLSNETSFHFHLKRCEHCQNSMMEYRLLYGDLKREPDVRLSEHFAATVASHTYPSSSWEFPDSSQHSSPPFSFWTGNRYWDF